MFTISDKSEEDLIRHKKWTSKGLIYGGGIGAFIHYIWLLAIAGAL